MGRRPNATRAPYVHRGVLLASSTVRAGHPSGVDAPSPSATASTRSRSVAQLKAGARSPAAIAEWHGSQLLLKLQGAWVMESAEELEAALAGIEWGGASQIEFDISALAAIDFTGASLIHAFLRPIEHASIDVRWRGALPEPVRLVERTLGGEGPEGHMEGGFDLAEPVRTLGRWAVQRYQAILAILSFFGRFCYSLLRPLQHVRH